MTRFGYIHMILKLKYNPYNGKRRLSPKKANDKVKIQNNAYRFVFLTLKVHNNK